MAVGGTGLAGVHERSKELASQRVGFGLRKFTPEFRWDGSKPPQENALSLRVLGDDIMITTQSHRGVPLPDNKFFFGVCRKAFPIESDYCYVCDELAKNFEGDAKQKKRNGLIPTDIAAALALEMEPIMNGRIFAGWKPKMVDFKIPQVTEDERDGKATDEEKEYRKLLNKLGQPDAVVKVPNIGMMVGTLSGKQALFDAATRKPTISDRVYEISRYGKALDTVWEWNHDGSDKENPDPSGLLAELRAEYPFELPEEWAARTGAEDRYNFFFKIGPQAESTSGESAAATSSDEVDPVADSRERLMNRLAGKSS